MACKKTLATNGYLNDVLVASALVATIEVASDEATALRDDIIQFADARIAVDDDACSLVARGVSPTSGR